MKFEVGDVAVTCGSRFPVLNDNRLVVIVGIDPGHRNSATGELCPYRVRQVTGEPFVAGVSVLTARPLWGTFETVWGAERQLRRIDDELVGEDVQRKSDRPVGVSKRRHEASPRAVGGAFASVEA